MTQQGAPQMTHGREYTTLTLKPSALPLSCLTEVRGSNNVETKNPKDRFISQAGEPVNAV